MTGTNPTESERRLQQAMDALGLWPLASNPPRVLYHATNRTFDRPDPDRSGLGTHFGTRRAAEDRMRQARAAGLRAGEGEWRLERYRVSISRPLALHDVGAWDSEADVEHGMIRAGVMQRADLRESRALSGAAFWAWARAKIEAAGYDSVVYPNRQEGGGGDSYVVWRDDQVRRES